MAFYEVRDIKVQVQSFGEGFPLIGIMGLGANSDYWSPDFIAGVSKTRRFILLDNRGAGDSSRGSAPMTFSTLADDLKALLDQLGIAQADFIGVSMGGMIVQQFVLSYPAAVRK